MKTNCIRLSLLLFIIIGINTLCHAQNDEERAAKGKEILDKSSARTKSYANISTNFTLTIENKQARTIDNFDGSLRSQGEKYHLSIMNTETYFDGKVIYAWSKDNHEVTISLPDDSNSGFMTPQQILGRFDDSYKILFIDEIEIEKRVCNEVDLYPIDRHTGITRIRLFIDKQTSNIKSIIQQNKDGNIYTVKINTFDTKTPLTDSEFTFDKKANPSVEIIDMR